MLCVFVVCLWGFFWLGFFVFVCSRKKKNVRNLSVFFSGQEFESMSVTVLKEHSLKPITTIILKYF